MKLDNHTYKLTDSGNFGKIALIAGIFGLGASIAGFAMDRNQFFFSYLTAFAFWTTIGLGGLFLTMIQHLTGAYWSIVLRRFLENIMSGLPLMALFFIPILLFGMHDLYHWADVEQVAHDAILTKKKAYLNPTFFSIRAAVYFTVWFTLVTILYKTSIANDEKPAQAQIDKMQTISAPGMILFAFSLTYASYDWLMSLDPHWYSTIFGLYVFAGSVFSCIAVTILLLYYVQSFGILTDVITVEHRHDLGKLLFTFNVFWAYMAFSNYFLIWYANIPEETLWFSHRWPGNWKYISLTLLFGHFFVPFFLLMPRAGKRNRNFLAVIAAYLLVMQWVDMYWLIQPANHHLEHSAHFSWMDFTTWLGIGGIFLWFVWQKFTKNALLPLNDYRLATSKQFKN